MPIITISDKPVKGLTDWLIKTADELQKYNVQGLAIVALVDPPRRDEADVLTGYYKMSLDDKSRAASHIQMDVVDGLVRANLGRYLQELDEDGENTEE